MESSQILPQQLPELDSMPAEMLQHTKSPTVTQARDLVLLYDLTFDDV